MRVIPDPTLIWDGLRFGWARSCSLAVAELWPVHRRVPCWQTARC